MQSYPKFHNEVGVPVVRVGCREFKCIGAMPPEDHPHIYLNMGDANEVVCPIAPRYSLSIRAWAHMKLIRQIVLTVTWTELKSSNEADAAYVTIKAAGIIRSCGLAFVPSGLRNTILPQLDDGQSLSPDSARIFCHVT
jgi:uncharacterized Zn-finger protein